MMEIEQIQEKLKSVLSKSRYEHSIGVQEVSDDLAVIYGYDEKKAALAGILHDCAKYLSDEELLKECRDNKITVTAVERRCPFLLHAKVGALYAQKKYEIDDQDILTAIRFHTTGRPGMTLLEKILFISDYIEPYRKPLPRIEEIRKAAYFDLDRGVSMTLENMIVYLKETGRIMDTTTQAAYNYYNQDLNKSYLYTGIARTK